MGIIREWVVRLWGTLRPQRADDDLEEELRLHVELARDAERRRYGDGEDARRAAAIRTGGITQSVELLRDQRGLPWLADLGRDVRYGFRIHGRSPMFASIAMVTLAVGAGANIAIFSLADAVLFRALPVSDPRELVILRQHGPSSDIYPFTSAAAEHLASGRDVLAGLAAFRPIPNAQITAEGETELDLMQWVSGNYHGVLGVHAIAGRTLVEQDRDPVAVISHRFWQRRFGGSPNVVGRVLTIQDRSFTIVGVTPAGFYGTQPGRYVDVTAPLAAQTLQMPPNARWLYLIGRRAPNVSVDQARAALRVRWSQLGGPSGARSQELLEIDSGAQGLNELRRDFWLPLQILMAVVCVVLLVACANLAGLSIVRSSARQQEISVRLSLGASRERILRQLLTESALLAAAGGAAALLLANSLTNALVAMMSRGRAPIVLDVAPNPHMFAFAAIIVIGTIPLFGLAPAIVAIRGDVQGGLKRRVFGRDGIQHAFGRMMVATQVALLVLLLTTAGLFVRTLQKLQSVDLGFHPANLLVVNVPTGPGFRGTKVGPLLEDLLARFSALSAIQSITRTMDTPLGGEPSMSSSGVSVVGRSSAEDDAPTVYHNFVGPRFFETMGIPLVAGRDFEARDDEHAPLCVIVSESLVRHYFPGQDPVGHQILFRGMPASIIGVAKDIRFTSLRADVPLVTYRPYRQDPAAPANTFLIRTSANVEGLAPVLRAQMRAASPGPPPLLITALEDQVAGGLFKERMLAALSSAIGLVAALLAAVGIHSVVASVVARRQREIGIRMAIGAAPRQVVQMVVNETFKMVAGGVAAGVVGALAAALVSRTIVAGVLFQLSPSDPLILSSAVCLILLIASLAAFVPARRASRIDPVAAIKYD